MDEITRSAMVPVALSPDWRSDVISLLQSLRCAGEECAFSAPGEGTAFWVAADAYAGDLRTLLGDRADAVTGGLLRLGSSVVRGVAYYDFVGAIRSLEDWIDTVGR